MSYVSPLRLHFAGRFQAAVSTVNNDPLHYDNATFLPSYQELQTQQDPNGWFNPRGSGVWRLLGCAITGASRADGSPAPPSDPIRTYLIADSDRAAPGKLVDLDTEQQLVSQIWGLEVRICDTNGVTYLCGRYEPAAFMDIWNRATGPGSAGDIGAGAMYQSVLTDLVWGDVARSPFLQGLQAAATDGLLSIKFNVDGINLNFTSDRFMTGRIVGTIGPASAAEPRHFVPGRQFMTTGLPGGFFRPVGGINFCVAVVDRARGKVLVDLGNALQTTTPGGPLRNIGTLALAVVTTDQNGNPVVTPIGTIPYQDADWYPSTAGVVELPADRALTEAELDAIASSPLALQRTPNVGAPVVAIAEPATGAYLRADQYVYRLNPDEPAEVALYATRFGEPYGGARIVTILDPSQLQPNGSLLGQPPDVGVPESAIDFAARVIADADGRACLTISARDPGNPRGYLDGQVYGLRPVLEETILYPFLVGQPYPFNQWSFVSLLVWDRFQPDEPPTWHGSLQPIFQQYANLYPVMDRFLSLGDYESVCAHRDWLQFAFGKDAADPNVMPVTRDLSASRRQAILRWLAEVGEDGKPLLGTPPAPAPPRGAAPTRAAPAVAAPTEASPAAPATPDPSRHGKAAAAGRRLGQRPSPSVAVEPLPEDRP